MDERCRLSRGGARGPEGAIRAAGIELSDAEWAAVRSFDWSVSDQELMARVSKSGHMMYSVAWLPGTWIED